MNCKHSIGIVSWPYDGWMEISDGDLSEIGLDDADNLANSGTLYINDYCPDCGAKLEIMQEKVGRRFLLKNIAPKRNSMSIEKVQKMALELAKEAFECHDSYTKSEIIAFIEQWRKNNDC